MIHVQMPAEDPIHAAIARHRAAYDAFQVAPEGTPSVEANDEYDAASDALVSTACATRFGALALLTHLRWWLADEAEFKAGHQPAYGLAEARAADLTLFLGTPLSPAMRLNGDVLAGFLPQAAPAGCLGRALPACDRRRHGAARAAPSEPLPGEGAEAALIVSARPDTAHVRAPRLLTLSGEILASFLLSRDKTVLPECGRSGQRHA